jgi:tetratricopeptide (TPR) repeat protein
MRRSFLALVSILILTFAAIAILKNWPRQASTEEGDVAMAVGEKEKIQQFWTVYRKATDYRIAGNIEEANEHYQAALELNDNHEDTWYYLAASYRALGKLDKAEDAWTIL